MTIRVGTSFDICVDAHAVGVDIAVFDPGAGNSARLWGFQLSREVADGYIELHFGAQAGGKKVWRVLNPPVNIGQGMGSCLMAGAAGEVLRISASGTGLLNGWVQVGVVGSTPAWGKPGVTGKA